MPRMRQSSVRVVRVSSRRPIASSEARERRWMPEVRRLAIGAKDSRGMTETPRPVSNRRCDARENRRAPGVQHGLPVESAAMTHTDEAPPRQNAFALVRQLVSGMVRLAKLELQHGRQEIGAMLGEAGIGVAMVAVRLSCAVSLATLDVAIVLGIAALFEALPGVVVAIIILIVFVGVLVVAIVTGVGTARPPGWAIGVGLLVVALLAVAFALPAYLGFRAAWHAALFVFTTQLLVAALIAWRGVRRIKVGPPEETIASVKEDVAWAKRLLKRG